MSLAEAFEAETRREPKRCAAVRVADDMDEADAGTYFGVLAESPLSASAIARALGSQGYRLSQSSISNHRRGECICESR